MAKVSRVFISAMSPSHYLDDTLSMSYNGDEGTIIPKDVSPHKVAIVQKWISDVVNLITSGKEVMLYGQEWLDVDVKMDDGQVYRINTNRPTNHASYAIHVKPVSITGDINGLYQGLAVFFSTFNSRTENDTM